MTIYSSNYRRIWEKANNKAIPKGYHIHHIDGNHFNNDPNNLMCVSPQEHYDIHYKQGDDLACARLAPLLGISPEIISELCRKANQKRIENKTHHLLGGDHHRELAKKGKHPAQIRSANGTNPFQDSEWKRQNALKLLEEGRHSSQIKKECPHCKNKFSAHIFDRHVNCCKNNPNRTKNKIIPAEKKQCPHCLGFYDPGNYKKHHGDNCKVLLTSC